MFRNITCFNHQHHLGITTFLFRISFILKIVYYLNKTLLFWNKSTSGQEIIGILIPVNPTESFDPILRITMGQLWIIGL